MGTGQRGAENANRSISIGIAKQCCLPGIYGIRLALATVPITLWEWAAKWVSDKAAFNTLGFLHTCNLVINPSLPVIRMAATYQRFILTLVLPSQVVRFEPSRQVKSRVPLPNVIKGTLGYQLHVAVGLG
jgi:hypothetical protein